MLVLGPMKYTDLLLDLIISLGGCTVFANKTAKDLDLTLDPDLSFDGHIKTVSRTAFFHLHDTYQNKVLNNFSLCCVRLLES
jgi:hypothetical protein